MAFSSFFKSVSIAKSALDVCGEGLLRGRGDCNFLLVLSIAATALLGSSHAVAGDDDLREIDKHTRDETQKRQGIFRSTPITHFTPSANTVTWALDLRLIDMAASGDPDIPSEEKLSSEGHIVTPYLALSLKRIGLGLAGEFGRRKTSYDAGFSNFTEESSVDYSGVGIYLFATPIKPTKKMKVTLVAGGRFINAKHKAESFDQTGSPTTREEEKYTVFRTQIGLDLEYKFSKSLRLLPWVDYTSTNTSQIDDKIESTREANKSGISSSGQLSMVDRFEGDVQIHWHGEAPLVYGLDFVTRIAKFDIHLGDLIGYALNRASKSERVEDNRIAIGISYETKAR